MVNSNMSCVVISYYLVVTPKTTTAERKTHHTNTSKEVDTGGVQRGRGGDYRIECEVRW